MGEKTIVCLAKSRKNRAYCIAGKSLEKATYGKWIRPVFDEAGEELQKDCIEYKCPRGTEPKVGDVIKISFKKKNPRKGHQTENHLIDKSFWIKDGEWHPDKIHGLLDSPEKLWLNKSSSKNGLWDRVCRADINECTNSLYLIEPKKTYFCRRTIQK